MIKTATLPLRGTRTTAFVLPITFIGVDLTGAELEGMILQNWDNNPDDPEIALPDGVSAGTTGFRFLGVETIDGAPHSSVEMEIAADDMSAIPPAAEVGKDLNWVWMLNITMPDDVAQRYLEGRFIVGGAQAGSGNVNGATVTVIDDSVTVTVEGADLLAPLVVAAEASAELARQWAESEGEEPGGAGTKSAKEWAGEAEDDRATTETYVLAAQTFANEAEAAANIVAALANRYSSIALGLAGTASGGFFSVSNVDGSVSIYKDNAGVEQLMLTLSSTMLDHLGRTIASPALLGQRSVGSWIHKALYDVRNGNRLSLTLLTTGDSRGTIQIYPGVAEQLMRIFTRHFQYGPVQAPRLGIGAVNPNTPARSGMAVTSLTTATRVVKSDYTRIGQGSYWTLDSGHTVAIFAGFANNGSIICDRVEFFIFREPGAGIVELTIASGATAPVAASGSWVTPSAPDILTGQALTGGKLRIDASGTAGTLIYVQVKVAYGPWAAKAEWISGGSVRVLQPFFPVRESAPAINVYELAVSSNNFTDESALAVSNNASLIAT